MLTATLPASTFLKTGLQALNPIGDLELSPTSLALQGFDSAQVAVCTLSLPPTYFTAYHCVNTRTIGIKLKNLAKVLGILEGRDNAVTVEHTPDCLRVKKQNAAEEKCAEYELTLVVPALNIFGIPEIAWEATCVLPSVELGRICKDLERLGSEAVRITATSTSVQFRVEDVFFNGCITLHPYNDEDYESRTTIEMAEDVESVELTFSLSYLTKFAPQKHPAVPLSEKVR